MGKVSGYDKAYFKKMMKGITVENYKTMIGKRKLEIKRDMDTAAAKNLVMIDYYDYLMKGARVQKRASKNRPDFSKRVKSKEVKSSKKKSTKKKSTKKKASKKTVPQVRGVVGV